MQTSIKAKRKQIQFLKQIDKIYQKGVSLTKKEMESYEERINRSEKLPKWDVTIAPVFG